MKQIFLLACATLALATGCKKDAETSPAPTSTPMQVSATLTGAQEIPAVTTSATGNLMGTYDKSSMKLTYAVTYAGLTPIMGHFHLGGPAVASGPVSIVFSDVSTSPITGTITLSQAQHDALLASGGGMYVNLHTDANKGGELRGNVIVK